METEAKKPTVMAEVITLLQSAEKKARDLPQDGSRLQLKSDMMLALRRLTNSFVDLKDTFE
jgi:hypothetical protein